MLLQLIEYFRESANRHKDIACYRTGEGYELNESGFTYPLLFLHTDVTTSFSSESELMTENYIYLSFRLSCITKSREQYDERPDNEIKLIGTSTKQNQDLDATHRILTQVVSKAIYDFNELFLNGWMLAGNNFGGTLKRITNDDCDGWYVDLTIKAHNDEYCSYEDAFLDDVIDKSTNKTQYSQPVNSSPIQKTNE